MILTGEQEDALLRDQSWRTDRSVPPEIVAELEFNLGLRAPDPRALARAERLLGPLPPELAAPARPGKPRKD